MGGDVSRTPSSFLFSLIEMIKVSNSAKSALSGRIFSFLDFHECCRNKHLLSSDYSLQKADFRISEGEFAIILYWL